MTLHLSFPVTPSFPQAVFMYEVKSKGSCYQNTILNTFGEKVSIPDKKAKSYNINSHKNSDNF